MKSMKNSLGKEIKTIYQNEKALLQKSKTTEKACNRLTDDSLKQLSKFQIDYESFATKINKYETKLEEELAKIRLSIDICEQSSSNLREDLRQEIDVEMDAVTNIVAMYLKKISEEGVRGNSNNNTNNGTMELTSPRSEGSIYVGREEYSALGEECASVRVEHTRGLQGVRGNTYNQRVYRTVNVPGVKGLGDIKDNIENTKGSKSPVSDSGVVDNTAASMNTRNTIGGRDSTNIYPNQEGVILRYYIYIYI